MGEDGGVTQHSGGHGGAPSAPAAAHHGGGDQQAATHAPDTHKGRQTQVYEEEDDDPMSPTGASTPNPFSRRQTSLDLDDYFKGPRDIAKHSKWPLFMQLHGSILPKMIVPLLAVAAWSTMITLLTKLVPGVNLGIDSILLTITGFVVGLGLSFRSSTAYERYAEGRRYWGQLILTCQALGRCFWIHTIEREGFEKEDILGKLTAMNLLVAFSVSLKHRLRFEPYGYYEDLTELIAHLDTFAAEATNSELERPKRKTVSKVIGESLGLSFAQSNPRKLMKKAKKPLGNLPLEILCYLSAYVDEITNNKQLVIGMQQTAAYNSLQALNDVLVNTERVLNTPLPIAYAIAIQQITWLYVFLLPFQLLSSLDWITIPATVAAAAIILSILFIGREVENPFGDDVNDLPLDVFCAQIVQDMETISARARPLNKDWIETPRNKVLFPHSNRSYRYYANKPEFVIRRELINRPHESFLRNEEREAQQAGAGLVAAVKQTNGSSHEKQDV